MKIPKNCYIWEGWLICECQNRVPQLGYWAAQTNGHQTMSDTHNQGREDGRESVKCLKFLSSCSAYFKQ